MIRGATLNKTLEFVLEECCDCGVPFMMTRGLYNQLQKLGPSGSFYCPNGHSQHYIKSTESALREKLEKERQERYEESQRLKRDIETYKDLWNKKIIENKKITNQKKRLEKRIHAGVCPCCNRTFQNCARHMQTKHPGTKDKTNS